MENYDEKHVINLQLRNLACDLRFIVKSGKCKAKSKRKKESIEKKEKKKKKEKRKKLKDAIYVFPALGEIILIFYGYGYYLRALLLYDGVDKGWSWGLLYDCWW